MKRISPVAVLSVLVLAASEAPTTADESMPIPPIQIAHRGLLRHAPENTLPAFAACLALGMGFELDIRTTKDGHLVVLHDDNIQRTTNGPSRSVRDMTLNEVKRLDAGGWFDKTYAGVRVPTLEETLSLVSHRKRGPTIIALNVQNIDLISGLAWVKEKVARERIMVLPEMICRLLKKYLEQMGRSKGPLFLSKRGKRISPRTLQDIFHCAADNLSIHKHLHAHLFRHTAATHLNRVAGTTITQHVLGHAWRKNTYKYTHLNPDYYAGYMKKHPFMNI